MRTLAALLSTLLLASLVACGGSGDDVEEQPASGDCVASATPGQAASGTGTDMHIPTPVSPCAAK